MSMPQCPYIVGQTYYRAQHQLEQVRVSCPICDGHKTVEVILGSGEHLIVPCEGCGLGFEEARGYIEQHEYRPCAVPFMVASIEGYSHGNWTILSAGGDSSYGDRLYGEEREALAASQKQADEQKEQNARSYSQTKASAKKLTWSIPYHRECIKNMERRIEYHKRKIGEQSGEAT
jgi:hypothetical protein